MISTPKPPVVAWEQVLCSNHAGQAADGVWPFGSTDVQDVRTSCVDCNEAMLRHLPVDGDFVMRAFPDLTRDRLRRLTAVSAAATVTVARLTMGIPVDYVDIEPPPGLGTAWWSQPFPADYRYVAMQWAGGVAGRRWLTDTGRDSPANRIGVTIVNQRDRAEARRFAVDNDIPLALDAGYYLAEQSVQQQWQLITDIADELVAHTMVTGNRITQIIGDTASDHSTVGPQYPDPSVGHCP